MQGFNSWTGVYSEKYSDGKPSGTEFRISSGIGCQGSTTWEFKINKEM